VTWLTFAMLAALDRWSVAALRPSTLLGTSPSTLLGTSPAALLGTGFVSQPNLAAFEAGSIRPLVAAGEEKFAVDGVNPTNVTGGGLAQPARLSWIR
jgi:hypothetical protein